MITLRLHNDIKNDSLQINDIAYAVSTPSTVSSNIINVSDGEIYKVGIIKSISGDTITVEETQTPNAGDFLMFSKDKNANNTSLLGYYAEVKLKNNSTEKAELFTLSSEITQSSK